MISEKLLQDCLWLLDTHRSYTDLPDHLQCGYHDEKYCHNEQVAFYDGLKDMLEIIISENHVKNAGVIWNPFVGSHEAVFAEYV